MRDRVVVPSDTMRRKGESGEHKTAVYDTDDADTHAHTESGTGSTAAAAEEECGRLWIYGGESLS